MADNLVAIDQSFFGNEELALMGRHYGLVQVWSVTQIFSSFSVIFLLLTLSQVFLENDLNHMIGSLDLY